MIINKHSFDNYIARSPQEIYFHSLFNAFTVESHFFSCSSSIISWSYGTRTSQRNVQVRKYRRYTDEFFSVFIILRPIPPLPSQCWQTVPCTEPCHQSLLLQAMQSISTAYEAQNKVLNNKRTHGDKVVKPFCGFQLGPMSQCRNMSFSGTYYP